MRIDLLITEIDVGGAEQCLAAIATHLHRRSHSVRLIAIGPPPTADRDRVLRSLLDGGIDVRFLISSATRSASADRRRNALRLPFALRRLIGEGRPDVALSFLFHANTLSSLVYPKAGVPLACGVRLADPSRLRAAVSRFSYRRADKVICVAESVRRHVEAKEGAPSGKTLVIANGIDAAAWRAKMRSAELATASAERPTAIFVGRYAPQKRIEWILRLIEDPRFAATGFRVAMVGDGPQRDAVAEAARTHPNRLIDLGRRDDIAAQMGNAQMLLLPSRYEGMPNALLEAMASGLPAAATDVEGVRELLGDSADRQCVASGDEEAWRRLVLGLAGDAELRRELGAANFARCRTQFSLQDRLAEYEAVLKRL